jgi:hypothetical protein
MRIALEQDADPFLELVGETDEGFDTDGETWEPLTSKELPAFPVDALPAPVAAIVRATAEHTQTPADLAALSALGVLSAVALGTVVNCGGWQEEVALYLLAAMPSGDRKSSVLKIIVASLRQIEKERREAAAESVRALQNERAILEGKKRHLTKEAAKDSPKAADLDEVCERLDEIGEPVLPRLLVDDATPEALGEQLWRHDSIAVLAAESALMDNLVGRYSEGRANFHLACGAYSGEPTTIDRKGHEPRHLERPLLTILLTVQPHVLEQLVSHETARSQGLVARFAYVRPLSRLGQRRVNAPAVPISVIEAWDSVVRRVTREVPEPSRGPEITLTPGAAGLLTELQEQLEPRLGPSGDLHSIGDWVGRHHGRVARIAGLLHLCEHSANERISEETMLAAIKIGDYLLEHGKDALLGPDARVRRALVWFKDRARRGKATSTVTQHELHNGPMNKHGKAEEAAALAERLVMLGILKPVAVIRKPTGRPQSPAYAVHPAVIWSTSSGSRDRDVPQGRLDLLRDESTTSPPSRNGGFAAFAALPQEVEVFSEAGSAAIAAIAAGIPLSERRLMCNKPDEHRGARRLGQDGASVAMCARCYPQLAKVRKGPA